MKMTIYILRERGGVCHLRGDSGILGLLRLQIGLASWPDQKGADVTYGGHWCSTLAVAISYGQQEIVELLLNKGAVVNHPNFGYSFALFLVSFGGYRRIVQLLLKNGAIGDDDKWSPHEAALKGGHQDIVELLLNHKTDVNQGSKGGITGLLQTDNLTSKG